MQLLALIQWSVHPEDVGTDLVIVVVGSSALKAEKPMFQWSQLIVLKGEWQALIQWAVHPEDVGTKVVLLVVGSSVLKASTLCFSDVN